MTKAELNEIIEIKNAQITRANDKISELESELKEVPQKIKEALDMIEELEYKNWKASNEKFLNRFMKEYLKDHLSIQIECEEGGYVEGKLYIDDEEISNGSDQVCTRRLYS